MRNLWVAVLLCSTQAAAASGGARSTPTPTEPERLAVIGVGVCDEPKLAEASRAMRTALETHLGSKVLSEEATAEPAGGLERTSLEEVRRAIESGKSEFLNLNIARAEKTLKGVLPEVDRLPLGPQRWEAYWGARAHLARLYQYSDQKQKATELFLDVLRVQESFQLSRIEFPPSARDLLESTRSLLQALPRFTLKVVSREAGAQVYVNGFPVGRTPFERKMASGTYEVVVGDAKLHSFVRKVPLVADTTLDLDVVQEGRLLGDRGPCWRAQDRKERLAGAALVASRLTADQVVTVRFEKLGEEEYLAAALLEVGRGREVREGRVRLERGALPPLARLAQFVLTGEGNLESPPAPPPAARVEPAPPPVAAASQGPAPAAEALKSPYGDDDDAPVKPVTLSASGTKLVDDDAAAVAPAAPPSTQASGATAWQRPTAWALAVVAVVAVGVAVAEQVHLGSLQNDLAGLVIPGSDGAIAPSDVPRMNSLRSGINSATVLRTGMAICAGAAAVGSGVLFVLSIDRSPHPQGASGGTAVSMAIAGSF